MTESRAVQVRRCAVSLLIPIREDVALPALEQELPKLTLEQGTEVHFARLAVVGGEDPKLLYAASVDGNGDWHLKALSSTNSEVLGRLLSAYCAGCPEDGSLYDYLRAHWVSPSSFYEGTRGRTVSQILSESTLRKKLTGFLDEGHRSGRWASESALQVLLQARQEALSWRGVPNDAPPKRRLTESLLFHVGRIGGPLVVLLAAVLPPLIASLWIPWTWATGGWLVALLAAITVYRLLERIEPTYGRGCPQCGTTPLLCPDCVEKVRRLELIELSVVRSYLTVSLPVKPSFWRPLFFNAVLLVASWFARFRYYKGSLVGVSTIHFARVLKHNGRMVFASSYDGSWGPYVEDFLDIGTLAVVPIWSNLRGCPPTFFLFWPGVDTFVPEFKRFVRDSQAVAHYSYNAYPDLSVPNINDNTEARRLLWEARSEREARRWLALLAK